MNVAKTKCYWLFPVPVALVQFDDYEGLNRKILDEINAVDWDAYHKEQGISYGAGHTRAEDTFINVDLVPSCVPVLKAFTNSCNQLAEHLSWNIDSTETEVTAFWAHVTKPGEVTAPHHHVDCYKTNHLSGVYYVKAPDAGGDILFSDDRLVRSYEPAFKDGQKAPYSLMQGFHAKEGLMLLFPSWLTHRVGVNKSGETRVSLSFNLNMTPR